MKNFKLTCQHFVSFRGDTYATTAGKLCRECKNLSIDCSDEPESFNTGLAACCMQKEKENTRWSHAEPANGMPKEQALWIIAMICCEAAAHTGRLHNSLKGKHSSVFNHVSQCP